MRISRKIYEKVLAAVRETSLETGGILGGKNGIITVVELDEGILSNRLCSYTPDVKKLNRIIRLWGECGTDFSGIFHTHYFGVGTLSEGDIYYIERIMKNMPENIIKLYFPLVVLPQKEMVVYVALKKRKKIAIKKEKIIIQEEKNSKQEKYKKWIMWRVMRRRRKE